MDREVAVLVVACTEEPKKSTKVKMGAADEVDLERDVAVVYEECKQAPKESLWAKIKKHV